MTLTRVLALAVMGLAVVGCSHNMAAPAAKEAKVVPDHPVVPAAVAETQPKAEWVAPHTVTKTYETYGCPEGYEGRYLRLNAGWGTSSSGTSSWSSSGNAETPVCISKKLLKELSDEYLREAGK